MHTLKIKLVLTLVHVHSRKATVTGAKEIYKTQKESVCELNY